MSTVALPRWAVGLLVGTSALSILAVTFLLGRATAPGPPAAPAGTEAAAPSPGDVSDAPRGLTGVLPADQPTPPIVHDPPAGTAVPSAGELEAPAVGRDPAAGALDASASGLDAAAVAAYFGQMDALSAEAKTTQDPQAVARSVLEQAMSGNTSAIEGLIATQRSLETRLGRIVPPPSCREHHQRSVRLFGRAIALLERTRDVMSGQATADLAGVAGEGRAIETEAKALDSIANDLRRAAGLATVP